MRLQESKEIDGFNFKVMQLPAMRGVKLWHKLVRTAGPAVLKAFGSLDLAKMNLANLDIGELADGAKMLLENFSEGDLEQLVKTVFEGATLGTEGHEYPLMQVMDEKLSGRVMTLLKGVWFALQVNFGDFFGALRASAGAEAPLLKSKA